MVKFIVDSTFGATKEFAENNGIKTVGLTLLLDGKEYLEGTPDEWDVFYSAYARSKSAASTSQPSPQRFIDAIEAIYAEDKDADIIILTIGDRLSGTIGAANVAVNQFPERNIVAIDSHNGGPSSLMLLEELVKARDGGADFEELKALAFKLRDRISTIFVPATLTELARGGRVNKLISRIGNILNIKPVFEYAKNDLNILSKSLGVRRAIADAVSHMPKKFDRAEILYIYDDKYVELMRDKLFRTFGMSHIDVLPMCPVGGAHIGLGTVGIVALASEEA